MKTKVRFFSPKLFAFALRENYLFFLIYSIIAILSAGGASDLQNSFFGTMSIISISTVSPMLYILPILMIPLTVKALGFYMKRCDSDFFESLPYTRTEILFTYFAALSLFALL